MFLQAPFICTRPSKRAHPPLPIHEASLASMLSSSRLLTRFVAMNPMSLRRPRRLGLLHRRRWSEGRREKRKRRFRSGRRRAVGGPGAATRRSEGGKRNHFFLFVDLISFILYFLMSYSSEDDFPSIVTLQLRQGQLRTLCRVCVDEENCAKGIDNGQIAPQSA